MPENKQVLRTPLTDLLRITHPVLLAGMNTVASAPLAAAVSNAGGLGNIGGVGYTPKQLRAELAKVKALLDDKTAFGVDLLLPQRAITDGGRMGGVLTELIDIIIDAKARLFISAVGIPPKWAVDKLHAAGILYMNMCGSPHHVDRALDVGADIICAQGYEGGGHTGEIGTLALIPQCVDKVAGRVSPLTGKQVLICGAGGVFDGRGLSAMLALGAQGVWVGTRFVASTEATTTKLHKDSILRAGPADTIRTVIYSGSTMRVIKTDYVKDWEYNRPGEIRAWLEGKATGDVLQKGGKKVDVQIRTPLAWQDRIKRQKAGNPLPMSKTTALLVGQISGAITNILPARQIIEDMVHSAASFIVKQPSIVVAKL